LEANNKKEIFFVGHPVDFAHIAHMEDEPVEE
jgi:hypothetical protein